MNQLFIGMLSLFIVLLLGKIYFVFGWFLRGFVFKLVIWEHKLVLYVSWFSMFIANISQIWLEDVKFLTQSSFMHSRGTYGCVCRVMRDYVYRTMMHQSFYNIQILQYLLDVCLHGWCTSCLQLNITNKLNHEIQVIDIQANDDLLYTRLIWQSASPLNHLLER